jgi:hypothetical protein
MPFSSEFPRDTVTKTIAQPFPVSAVISELGDGKSWAIDWITNFTPDAGGSPVTKTIARAIFTMSSPSKDEVQFSLVKLVSFLGNATNYSVGGVTPPLSAAKNTPIVNKDSFLTAGGLARKDPI